MKRETTFKLAGKATLKVTERQPQQDKVLKNTLKASHDLHHQLTKAFNQKDKIQTLGSMNKSQYTINSSKFQTKVKNEEESLAQEVAALDDFVPIVSKDKTKKLVQNIKLRRREKHIEALEDFKEELQDYRDNLNLVYQSLQNDLQQVLAIRQNQLRQFFSTLTDSYLLTRGKQILEQIKRETSFFKQGVKDKLRSSNEEKQRIKADRQGLVNQRCLNLFDELVDIAFVLEDEARDISQRQKSLMKAQEEQMFNKTTEKLVTITSKTEDLFEEFSNRSNQLQAKWKNLNENNEIQLYLRDCDEEMLRWPEKRKLLYAKLITIQKENSQRKLRLISNLAKEHPDTFSKANLQKWNDHLKTINQSFDEELDLIIKDLLQEVQSTETSNIHRFQQLKNKISYIENRKPEEIDQLLEEKCRPHLNRNNQDAREILKQVTTFVQGADQRQNKALQQLQQFLMQIGKRSDQFVKKWGTLSQEYELEKAKILDEDDQIVEKLTDQLNTLKQQLKESLHHIKLEEIQKACFDKIDELEKVYRQTHQRNKEVVSKRPQIICSFIRQFESKIAEAFSLYDNSKKAELSEMARQQCQQKATKLWEEEEKKRQEQEAAIIEESKKKGGKAPAIKPKDPKKIQAEMQERKKVLMQEIGLRKIEEVATSSESIWLSFKSLVEICKQFYKEQEGKQVDELSQEIRNYKGDSLVTNQALISAKDIAVHLQTMRNMFFKNLGDKRQRLLSESQLNDNNFIEESLSTLDSRLRQHYPIKGKLQAEIGVVRSGQITSHKKEYEKHVRLVKEKMDLQTEKFNYLLEKCLQLFKDHNANQKKARQSLASGKNLSDFQGSHRNSHENFKIFSRQMNQIGYQLTRLSSIEVEAILQSNNQFLKKSKLLAEGGQFSQSQAEWYKQMMTEINQQIIQQRDKRAQKAKQIKQQSQNRSKQLIESFDKQYANYLEDLSAREGTGKKYGKPRRIAQQKIRFQMNKCEQAQISIEKQFKNILDLCQVGPPHHPHKPNFIQWQRKLLTLQNCIVRYARHIEAIVPNCKARIMPRITTKQNVSDAILSPEQEEQDKKRIIQQLKQLGPLSEQKQDKPFLKFLEDIEKIIGDEARTIYTGEKAKYITGNDKLPDFLRAYILNMRKSAEEFRQESIRKLRQSCNKFQSSVSQVLELFFGALINYFGGNQTEISFSRKAEINTIIINHSKLREQNLIKLRPNLSHPSCQKDLKQIDTKEQQRQSEYAQSLLQKQKQFENDIFSNASKMLNSLLNNYEVLLLLYDSVYLQEDFIKVAGDDTQEKVHLNVKKLMLMKQKGVYIDANSERNIKHKWDGVNKTIFDFGDKKFVTAVKAEEPKEKDKKSTKKDTKNKVEQVAAVNSDLSRIIETYKTYRQKLVFTTRNQTLNTFKSDYQRQREEMNEKVRQSLKENQSFKLKWTAMAKDLYIS